MTSERTDPSFSERGETRRLEDLDTAKLTPPRAYLLRMGLFLAVVVMAAAILYQALIDIFLSNVAINAIILGALGIGIAYTFARVLALRPEIGWVNAYRRGDPGLSVPRKTSLLAPMAAALRDRNGPMSLDTQSARVMLDSIGARLDESRDITRFLTGLLILLGLLGTVWGLLTVTRALPDIIQGLTIGPGGAEQAFDSLKESLSPMLAGMGTAFSSTLFGVAGSIILGFLGLQAQQAQNNFFNELEEWLSTVTRLSARPLGDAQSDGDSGALAPLLERAVHANEALYRLLEESERERRQADQRLGQYLQHLDARAAEMAQRAETRSETLRTEMKSEMKVFTKTIAALIIESRKEGQPFAEDVRAGNEPMKPGTGG